MVRIIIFAIALVFISCKQHFVNRNVPTYYEEQYIYSKIDTNAIFKKVSVEYVNVTGQFYCKYIKFKSNYKLSIYPCHYLKQSLKKKVKDNGMFYLIDSEKIGIKYSINSWHGKQKYHDTLYIREDSLIRIQNFTHQEKSIKKEVYVKYL